MPRDVSLRIFRPILFPRRRGSRINHLTPPLNPWHHRHPSLVSRKRPRLSEYIAISVLKKKGELDAALSFKGAQRDDNERLLEESAKAGQR